MNLIKNLFALPPSTARIYERSLKLQLILTLLKFRAKPIHPGPGNDEHATDQRKENWNIYGGNYNFARRLLRFFGLSLRTIFPTEWVAGDDFLSLHNGTSRQIEWKKRKSGKMFCDDEAKDEKIPRQVEFSWLRATLRIPRPSPGFWSEIIVVYENECKFFISPGSDPADNHYHLSTRSAVRTIRRQPTMKHFEQPHKINKSETQFYDGRAESH